MSKGAEGTLSTVCRYLKEAVNQLQIPLDKESVEKPRGDGDKLLLGRFPLTHRETFPHENNQPLESSPRGSGGFPTWGTWKMQLDRGWTSLARPGLCQERLGQVIPVVPDNTGFQDSIFCMLYE